MTVLDAVILGIVEGFTEFIPVSSTGHLILTKSFLNLSDSVDTYLITIQLGATLAVAIYYRARVVQMLGGITKGDRDGQRLLLNLLIAFLPAAVVGLLLSDTIERLFFNPLTVALALVVGGILMIAIERIMKRRPARIDAVDVVKPADALLVGFAQCFALWPGMSRSMSTIVGAQLRGFSNQTAADFSFLLALPTLGAATLYSLWKDRAAFGGDMLLPGTVGIAVSFVSGWLAVAWFLRILKRVGMEPFGWYRIGAGIIVLGLWLMGRITV